MAKEVKTHTLVEWSAGKKNWWGNNGSFVRGIMAGCVIIYLFI